MSRSRLVIAATALALLLPALAVTRLHGQASPSVSATADVTARVFTPLAVAVQEGLTFGNLHAPFAPKTVAFTDHSASARRARLTITGEGGAELAVTVTVPGTLAAGAATLPLSGWQLRVNATDVDNTGTDTALAAGANALTLTLPGSAATTSQLFLRLRATAEPGASQAAGSYSGTLTVAVNYTGS